MELCKAIPLTEMIWSTFYIMNLTKIVMVACGFQGLPCLPKRLPRAPKGLLRVPWSEVWGENNILLKWEGSMWDGNCKMKLCRAIPLAKLIWSIFTTEI